MKVMILGAGGFIGKELVATAAARKGSVQILAADVVPWEYLRWPWENVEHVVLDVTEGPAVSRAVEDFAPDVIFNATGVLGLETLLGDELRALHVNTAGHVNILTAAAQITRRRGHGPVVVYIQMEGDDRLSPYAISKHAAGQYTALARAFLDVDARAIKAYFVYGPGQHVASQGKLVPRWMIQAAAGMPLTVYGDGEDVIDLVFINDAARLIFGFGADITPGQLGFIRVDPTEGDHSYHPVWECGTGVGIRLRDLAEHILAVARDWGAGEGKVVYLPRRRCDNEVRERVANRGFVHDLLRGASLATNDVPYDFVDIHAGLVATYAYYSELYNECPSVLRYLGGK